MILWGLLARPEEYGNFGTRYTSFLNLLSINRVGTFIVDLAIFVAFKGWFIDNNLMQQEVGFAESLLLQNAAKFVLLFRLVAYLTLCLSLPTWEMD